MIDPTIRIVSLPEDIIANGGRVAPDDLNHASRAGFGAAIIQTPLFCEDQRALASLADSCRSAGLRLYADTDIARFPLDHGLVKKEPDAFAIRHHSDETRPVDPRNPLPASGEALARLAKPEFAVSLSTALVEALALMMNAGVSGFRFKNADRASGALLKAVIDKVRSLAKDDPIFIVDAGSEGLGSAQKLLPYGIDAVARCATAKDITQSWLLEEMDNCPVDMKMLYDLGGAFRGDDLSRDTSIAIASAVGAGVIIPLDSLCGERSTERATSVNRIFQDSEHASDFDGVLRTVSSDTAPVLALLRAANGDFRTAETALLILINRSAENQEVPGQESLSPLAQMFDEFEALTTDTDIGATMKPGEMRMMKAARTTPVVTKPSKKPGQKLSDYPRLVLENISPSVEGGDFAVKRVVGDIVTVEATAFGDGHEQLAAELRWRAVDSKNWTNVRMRALENDRWTADFPLKRMGRHVFVVETWLDIFGGFRRDFRKKLDAEVAQAVDHAEGRALVDEAVQASGGKTRKALQKHLDRLDKADPKASAALLLDEELASLMASADERPHALVSPPQIVDAERLEARFSTWYEIFPRSQTDDKGRHGTFADVIERLPHVRDMGFDTLYFPPIHPIGKTNRKGPNNTLTPGPDDHGSPYAIGSEAGGHDAIHPDLGTMADFDRLVEAAATHGLEIALDFAIQCSPDHPWLKEHPGWFAWRPDGSMKYAENPPKKYQDIVNVDFYGPDAFPGLWEALRDVVLLWVDHGVKTFRVDNPHTKPLPFWEWMIGEVRGKHPDVIFLSEAFTRPTMMYRLAKVGFSQSYTYFTWRDRKHELIDYISELTTTAPKEFYRPHFFVNTPDINPFFLQTGGRPAHRIRAVLAATLSGLWGVYAGFEHCDAAPLGPGKEEYLDSEKYEIRPRPERTPGDIVDDVKLLNRLRRRYPGLQTHLNTRFYVAHNENIIWYGKPSRDGDEMIMVMVNLDPHGPHECDFEIPLWEFGLPDDASLDVYDFAGGHRFEWYGKMQHIRLEPDEPYRIWHIAPIGGSQ